MQLETSRLLLREMTAEDYGALNGILGDSDIMQHYPYTFDEARVRNWIAVNTERYRVFGFGLWAVVLKETGEVIGDCGITMQKIDGFIRPEIGYHIKKSCQRQGYAKEAAEKCRDWAFANTPFGVLYSYMKKTNIASAATAKAIGMTFTGEYTDSENEITSVYAVAREPVRKPDTVPDTTPDIIPDTVPNTAPETVPDTTPETVPDIVLDKTRQPTIEALSALVGLPVYDGLFQAMRQEYGALCKTEYSGDRILLGWNVKFKKGGRTLCTVYPRRGYFHLLLVVGKKEKERVEALLPSLSQETQNIYRDTREGMGQRWMLFDFCGRTPAYEDVLKLIRIRRESR